MKCQRASSKSADVDATLAAVSSAHSLRASLVRVSRRHSRIANEAEDLAHDLIVSALRRGLPLDETFPDQSHGAARRHAAFLARSAVRRRARELSAPTPLVDDGAARDDDDSVEAAPSSLLSPALRTTLLLLVMGLEKAELCAALGVTDAALRKRFQSLRERAPLERPEIPLSERTPALVRLRQSHVEALPRLAARHAWVDAVPRILAASDPDGHGLIFAEALTRELSAATPGKSADTSHGDDRTHRKDPPCSTHKSRTSPSSSS